MSLAGCIGKANSGKAEAFTAAETKALNQAVAVLRAKGMPAEEAEKKAVDAEIQSLKEVAETENAELATLKAEQKEMSDAIWATDHGLNLRTVKALEGKASKTIEPTIIEKPENLKQQEAKQASAQTSDTLLKPLSDLSKASVDESGGVKFSKSGDKKTLIIQHNLTEENLLHADRMGGIPVPSLAITQAEHPLESFGEITLVGGVDMANPKGYAATKVYGADIYSPRYPTITYIVNSADTSRLNKQLKLFADLTGSGGIYPDDVRTEGKKTVSDNNAVRAKFLTENNITPEIKYNEKPSLPKELELFKDDNRHTHELIQDEKFRAAVIASHREELNRIYGDGNEDLADEEIAKMDEDGLDRLSRYAAREIGDFQRAMRETGKPDSYQTTRSLNNQIDTGNLRGKYNEYVDDVFASLKPEEKIFQGFTYSGNRKYIPHTLDNVIKILKKDMVGGEGFNYGVGTIRSKFTPKFKSIAEIQKSKDRLLNAEAFDEVKDEIDNEFTDLADSMRSHHPIGNDFGFLNTLSSTLYDASTMGLSRAFKENGFTDVTPEMLADSAEFLDKLRTLPTAYFEAKILRAVDLSEFKGAAVPKQTSQKAIDALNRRGITNIKYYDNNIDGDRAKKINELAKESDLLFSQSATKANNPHTLSTLATAIDKAMGRGFTKLLEDTGKFKLIESSQIGKYLDVNAIPKFSKTTDPTTYWHGSPSGDLRGGVSGLHLGTKRAAEEALEARIGIPAEGKWDGTREYGKTLLAGKKTQLRLNALEGRNINTGQNSGAPYEDYFPTKGNLKYADGTTMPMDVKPNILPYKLDTEMTNTRHTPLGDTKANASMKAQLKKGQAKRGYYYENIGEDAGSISVVVPNGNHVAEVRFSKDGRILAFVISGQTYLVADNISSTDDNIEGLLKHEIGVHALSLGRNDKEFQAILKQIEVMRKSGNKQVQSAYDRVPKDTPAHLILEETAGYLVEQAPDLSISKKIVAWFRAQIRKIGANIKGAEKLKFFQWANNLSPEDIVYMASQALRSAPTTLKDAQGRGEFKSDTQQPFYSQLRKVFRDAPDKIFTNGEQVKAWLAANAGKLGIKKDEIFWSGINDYLDIAGKVSKADVLAFLDGNGVKVEVKTLGSKPIVTLRDRYDFRRDNDGSWSVFDKSGELLNDGFDSAVDARDWAEEDLNTTIGRDIGDNTRFAQYQLPGGTNYREMLITLPKASSAKAVSTNTDGHMWDVEMADGTTISFPVSKADDSNEAFAYAERQRGTDFYATHFDQPNIVAHVRMNDRVDADGRRILFVEEVQSDASQGKRKGSVTWDAPFISDTKAFTSLAMKHVIQQAVEGGYDSVAWTTGEQQVVRYPEALRQVADHIEWKLWAPEVDGGTNKEVTIKKAGETIFRGVIGKYGKVLSSNRQQEAIGKGLDEIIGKTMAEQVLSDKAGEIAGEQFTVGGEGMKGYYDEILPQVVSGIFKQLKVDGKVESIATNGNAQEYSINKVPYGYAVSTKKETTVFKTESEAKEFAEKEFASNTTQPSFTITPELRAKVTNEGMPLFSKSESNPIKENKSTMDAIKRANEGRTPKKDVETKEIKPVQQPENAGRPLGLWIKGFTRNQLVDLYKNSIIGNHLKEYKRLREQIAADTNKLFEVADNFLGDLRSIPIKLRTQFADLAHQSTLHGVDPSSEKYVPSADAIEMDKFLATNNSNKKLNEKIKNRLEQMESAHKRLRAMYLAMPDTKFKNGATMRSLFDGLRQRYVDQTTLMFEAFEGRINRMDADEDVKKEAIKELRDQLKTLLDRVYFPLYRSGDYIIRASKQGAQDIVEHHETERERTKHAKLLRADGYTVSLEKRVVDSKNQKTVVATNAIKALVEEAAKGDKKLAGNELKNLLDEIDQTIIKSMPDAAYRRAFIHRTGTAGYSNDFIRAYASSMRRSSAHIANLRHGDKIPAVITDMRKTLKDAAPGSDTTALGDVVNRVVEIEEDLLLTTSKLAVIAGRIGFSQMLGSISNFILNASQIYSYTFPHLGAEYGFTKTMLQLSKAYAAQTAALKIPKSLSETGRAIDMRTRLKGDELEVFNRLHDSGKLDLSQAFDLIEAASTASDNINDKQADFMKFVGLPQHLSEVINRQVTAIAAIRLEMARSGDTDKAYNAAIKTIDDTHFDYSKGNRSKIMTSNTARSVLMFKTYGQNIVFTWGNTARLALEGSKTRDSDGNLLDGTRPSERKKARKHLAGLLGTQILAAGVLGLPIYTTSAIVGSGMVGFKLAGEKGAFVGVAAALIAVIASAFGDDDGEDFEVEMRKWLAKMLGDTWAEIISRGVTPRGLGSRMDASEPFVRFPETTHNKTKYLLDWMEATLGAFWGGTVTGALSGFYTAKEGEVAEGAKKFIPIKQLKDMAAAWKWVNDGYSIRDKNGAVITDVSKADVFWKAVGVNPSSAVKAQEYEHAMYMLHAGILNARSKVVDRLVAEKDPRKKFAEMKKWNDKWASQGYEITSGMAGGAVKQDILTRGKPKEIGTPIQGMYLKKEMKALQP